MHGDDYKTVFSYCIKRLRSHTDAEDVTQDVFLAYSRLVATPPDPMRWMIRTASNLCLAFLRKRRARQSAPIEDTAALPRCMESELSEHIRKSLTESEYAAISRLAAGNTITEIAVSQGITYEQSRHLIRKARKRAIAAINAAVVITIALGVVLQPHYQCQPFWSCLTLNILT
jgi:DNA-directed RNA polymerase specialized sigma24 family protein